ncbi:magnesium transporter [Sphingobium xanthum]|uniref:magnesium and cobalt transport protein CorA n=1 Tax=Sphingobium xanthum TaxID=1387165 RepID=UPI001C8C226B|nr:magnesium and cobalt transport protein CorA [Sphingobium xanthum]
MTVIAARRYKGGTAVEDVDIHGACPPPATGEFVWIGLQEPTPEELETVGRCFGLHPLALEDARRAIQLPKVEQYGDQLFLILRTAHLEGEHIAYGETSIFMGRGFIVTVRHGSARAHSELRAKLESAPAALAHGPDYVLHSILDFIVDGYYPIVETLEEQALAMEAHAGDSFLDRAMIRRIFAIRREVVRFQRILGVMTDVASRLVNVTLPHLDADMIPYFRDVQDHVRRAEYRLSGLREILTSVAETSSLLEQQRQGDITRQLAAWAAILAVPTAVAGIYGMNFDFMPELRWKYGYFFIVSVMASVCIGLYVRFRRAGWL